MLAGVDLALGRAFSPALISGRRRRLLVVGGVVLAFLIEREEAVELDHRAGRAQVDACGRAALAVMSAVVRSSSADSIWLAIVRSQISS